MSNYAESKKTLDKIRDKYGCKGEIIFRTAIQCVMQHGADNLIDDWTYSHMLDDINNRHDAAEAENKILFMSRDFEITILECSREIAEVNNYDVFVYIQREVWLSNEGIDYQRAIELLKKCMGQIEGDEMYEHTEVLNAFWNIGFTDDEIELLGFSYLMDEEEDN